jgi:hypothetical protein
MTRKFVAWFHFIDLWCWSVGIHVDFWNPFLELHVPFGFFRVGWESGPTEAQQRSSRRSSFELRTWGFGV